MKKNLVLVLLNYASVYIVWGSTYFFIKMAVQTIPSFYVVGLRFFIGGMFFLLFSFITKRFIRLPTVKETIASIFLGSLLLLGGNGLVTIAERKVDSYLAALVISSTPVAVAFFDWIFLKKHLSLLAIAGIILGIAGVSAILYNGNSFLNSFSPEILLVIGGLVSWSLATSLGHTIKTYPDVFINSSIQMLFVGGISLLILSLKQPSLITLIPTFSLQSIIALLFLAIIGSLAFSSYNFLIKHEPAMRVVSYAFVNPLIAMLLGIYLGKEKPVPLLLPGVLSILTGLFLMLYGDTVLKRIMAKKYTSHH